MGRGRTRLVRSPFGESHAGRPFGRPPKPCTKAGRPARRPGTNSGHAGTQAVWHLAPSAPVVVTGRRAAMQLTFDTGRDSAPPCARRGGSRRRSRSVRRRCSSVRTTRRRTTILPTPSSTRIGAFRPSPGRGGAGAMPTPVASARFRCATRGAEEVRYFGARGPSADGALGSRRAITTSSTMTTKASMPQNRTPLCPARAMVSAND